MRMGKEFRGVGPYLSMGIQMVIVTAVIALVGYWLDRKTGKAPLFLVIFFVLGSLGGLAFVWRALHLDDQDGPP